jgi:hypothetical protein
LRIRSEPATLKPVNSAPVVYREEVLTIMGVLGDIRAELQKINTQLGGDDGEEEEEDDV